MLYYYFFGESWKQQGLLKEKVFQNACVRSFMPRSQPLLLPSEFRLLNLRVGYFPKLCRNMQVFFLPSAIFRGCFGSCRGELLREAKLEISQGKVLVIIV